MGKQSRSTVHIHTVIFSRRDSMITKEWLNYFIVWLRLIVWRAVNVLKELLMMCSSTCTVFASWFLPWELKRSLNPVTNGLFSFLYSRMFDERIFTGKTVINFVFVLIPFHMHMSRDLASLMKHCWSASLWLLTPVSLIVLANVPAFLELYGFCLGKMVAASWDKMS